MSRLAIVALVLGFATSCAGPTGDQVRVDEDPSQERATIDTASTRVEVEALAPAAAEARTLVEASGGHIADSTVSETSAHIRARVPAQQLSSVLDSIGALGNVEHRRTTSQDVTDVLSDLDAEIGNLVALRERLRALLDRASTVAEVLEVERELTRIQTRLDSLQARRQRTQTDVELSVLTIELREKPPRRVLGPLGLLFQGTFWLVGKLFVIAP